MTLDPGDHSLSSVRELVCSIVDQKVPFGGFVLAPQQICSNSYRQFPPSCEFTGLQVVIGVIDPFCVMFVCGLTLSGRYTPVDVLLESFGKRGANC